MIKILFICHGNICRSPMAEFIFKKMVSNAGISDKFYIASAAVSNEEHGNPVYPPCRKLLNEHGIDCSEKRAVQIKKSDYDKYDYLIGMDSMNIRNMERITGHKKGDKIYKLLEFAGLEADCRDPWYTSRFDETYRDVVTGCTAFLEFLQKEGKIC